ALRFTLADHPSVSPRPTTRSSSGPSRAVRWIDIHDLPRPDAVELDDRLATDLDEVHHARGPEAVAARRHVDQIVGGELLAHPQTKRPRDDRQPFGLGVRMRWNLVSVRRPEAHGEGACFRGVALQHGYLRPRRQRGRAILPLDLLRRADRRPLGLDPVRLTRRPSG